MCQSLSKRTMWVSSLMVMIISTFQMEKVRPQEDKKLALDRSCWAEVELGFAPRHLGLL